VACAKCGEGESVDKVESVGNEEEAKEIIGPSG